MKDVLVIGGGPSGLHLARCLAAEGFDIEVLEEHAVAGEPVHCTGILAPEIFDEFVLPRHESIQELRTVHFHSPKGQKIRYRTEQVEALVVDRPAFDRSLKDLACAGGAQLTYGTKASKIEISDAGITVHCSDGNSRSAKACVLATGSSYALNRTLGIGCPPVFLNCAQIEVPADPIRDVEIFFGSEIAPKGFAWVVPVQRSEGHFARIGLMCDGKVEFYFRKFLTRLRPFGIEDFPDSPLRPRILPLAPIRKTYGNRFLVIGDAAGFVKPTTGGGVFYGMISAGIAANVLGNALRRNRLAEADLAVFEDVWKERLLEEIEAQLTLRFLMQRLTDEEVESIFDLWLTDGLMPLIRKTVEFNHHRKLIAAVTRYPAMRKILFRRVLC